MIQAIHILMILQWVLPMCTEKENEYRNMLVELRGRLVEAGVPGDWTDSHLAREEFRLHPKIPDYFKSSPEKLVDHEAVCDLTWYMQTYGVEAKIRAGSGFIDKHRPLLEKLEKRHGIHYELICGIIGMETNFAEPKYGGKFYAFNALVSQYLLTNRKTFAVKQLKALYDFSMKTGEDVYVFKGSYAGAVGWGQFIPSSLMEYFVDVDGNPDSVDVFSVEDNLSSIENYLYKSGLSGSNIDRQMNRYDAVYAYNHSNAYVMAVLAVYDGLRSQRKP